MCAFYFIFCLSKHDFSTKNLAQTGSKFCIINIILFLVLYLIMEVIIYTIIWFMLKLIFCWNSVKNNRRLL